jgi:hypothetical protein
MDHLQVLSACKQMLPGPDVLNLIQTTILATRNPVLCVYLSVYYMCVHICSFTILRGLPPTPPRRCHLHMWLEIMG